MDVAVVDNLVDDVIDVCVVTVVVGFLVVVVDAVDGLDVAGKKKYA